MEKYHIVEHISFEDKYILLKVDGRDYKDDLTTQSKILADSSYQIKNNFIVSPFGYGIHWPDIDEDLSIDGLLGIGHKMNLHKKVT